MSNTCLYMKFWTRCQRYMYTHRHTVLYTCIHNVFVHIIHTYKSIYNIFIYINTYVYVCIRYKHWRLHSFIHLYTCMFITRSETWNETLTKLTDKTNLDKTMPIEIYQLSNVRNVKTEIEFSNLGFYQSS